MKLPKYYCRHCEQFKKWYQVRYDYPLLICKHCNRRGVVYTEDLLESFIKETSFYESDSNDEEVKHEN